ncbi:MAG: ABC transporter ATP-binding protein/permease [Bacilli bacterium]|nr:ABC transporter ATP-binding protein/permease [Bacilli bacterium]
MLGSWRWTALTWVFITLEVVCEVLIPWVAGTYLIPFINPTQEMLDAGYVMADHIRELWGFAFIMLGLAIASCVSGIAAGFFAARASSNFGKNLRKKMFYKIQDFSFKNIDKFSTPSLVTRLTTDVTNIQNSVQMIIRMLVRAPFMMVFAFVMAATISPQLSLIFLGVVPFLAFALFFIVFKVHPIFQSVFRAYDRLNGSVEENLRGIRVVKSFGCEEKEVEKFKGVSGFIYNSFVRAERIMAFNNPVMQMSTYVCILLLSWFGAHIVISTGNSPSGFNTGSLTSLISYVTQILNSLMMVSISFVMIVVSRNSAERISEVLDEIPDLASPEDPIMEVPNGQVDFENVCFRYNQEGEKNVLDNVSIHVPAGSTVGIIGATGSSKSTFVSMIARLYDVNSGSVKVGGHDVRDYDLATLRDAVAVVLQKNVLFSGTIRSNLLWGNPQATDEEIEKAAKLACADEFIETLPAKYDSPIEQGGNNVSGGQKQRLCIARALLKKPKVLILDDSTSAVDTFTDSKIRAAFQSEIPETTKFIVAQRILSIRECDLILVLDDGRIIASGTHKELMKTSEVYREIHETQVRGGDFDAA